jgi:hypothetical protein
MLMRIILCVLCVAACSGAAGAQTRVSNFETCISEAKERHTDAVTDTYLSFKCDGATAQKLAARPDECAADVRPAASRIVHSWRPLDDGLYTRMIWSTKVCAGMCETRAYNDGRETTYLCEVRRHVIHGVAQTSSSPPPRPASYRRYPGDYPPRRWPYRPVRSYGQPAPYIYERRMPEAEMNPRRAGRWSNGRPDVYMEYVYPPADDPDDSRSDAPRHAYPRRYR